MPEYLRQTHQIIAAVLQELVCHRVPQQVRMNLETTNGGVLVAQVANPPIRERPSLTDEHDLRLNRRAGVEVGFHRPPGWEWKRHSSLFPTFAVAEHNRSRPLSEHQVVEFKGHHVADSAAAVQQEVEDGVRPDVLSQFDLSEQSHHLGTVESLRGKLLAAKLLHGRRRVRRNMALIDQPLEVPTDRHQCPIDGGDGVPTISSQTVPEVGFQRMQSDQFGLRLL